MKKCACLPAVVFLWFLLSGAAAAGELALGSWVQFPSGDLSYEAVDSRDEIDIEDHLDYDAETRITGRLKIDLPLLLPNFYLIAAPMEFDGTGRKAVDFRFGDEVFSADADISSELTLNQYDVAFFYGIPALRTATLGRLNVDVGLNARIVDFSASMSGRSAETPARTVREEESLTAVIPMAFAAVQFQPIERIALEVEARGIAISDDSLFSLIGRFRVKIVGPSFLAAGYRYDAVDIDEEDLKLDASFDGPFFEAGFAF